MENKDLVNEVIKNKSQSIKMKYGLRFFDMKKCLKEIDNEAAKMKYKNVVFPMGLNSFEDVIKFRCYDNEILDIMIKNDEIDIERIKEKIEFIGNYKKFLVDDFENNECVSYKLMLINELTSTYEDIKFLNELKK